MSNEQRELNLLGARVMGFELLGTEDTQYGQHLIRAYDGTGFINAVYFDHEIDDPSDQWNPYEDLNQAWEVAQKVGTFNAETEFGGRTFVKLWGQRYQMFTAIADTASIALMRAVREALNDKEEVRDEH